MSDGLSEGARWAEESAARQERIDAFFGMVADYVGGARSIMDGDAFFAAFRTFDAYRHAGSIVEHRLRKTVRKRWKAFSDLVSDAKEMRTDEAWAEILALALRYASVDVRKRLVAVSDFRGCLVALYVPEGRGREPSLYGDHEAAFDAAAHGGPVTVIAVDDRERAVVAIELGPKGGERREPERSRLRFIAVQPEDGG